MPVLQMVNISKYFPGIKANENVNFDLQKGEIHSILGENGAGKSTLMNILTGLYHPDNGKIILNGKDVKIHSPKNALSLGIGMVHQHFHLSERHTVYENVILGSKELHFIPNRKKLFEEINSISKKYEFSLTLNEKVWQLSISEQQKVEILKIIFSNPKILIFDEPTAVLTSKETEKLFEILINLKKSGYSIIFISHKLDEVMSISDRITILSRGNHIDTIEAKNTSKEDLAEKMVGRKIIFESVKPPMLHSEPILILNNAKAINDRGLTAINNLSLEIKKGEIFGIAGVSGNGQVELAEILFGLRKMENAEYIFKGKNIKYPSPKTMMNYGMSLIPADRKTTGTAIGMNIPENLILNKSGENQFSKLFFLRTKKIINTAKESTEKYKIQHQNLFRPVKDLSGGNLQKVIVAREIESSKEFLIAVYPSRGLDVGAIESIHKIFIDEQKKGATILVISEELEELFNLSDRIGVIYKGRIVKIFDRQNANLQEISLAMGGVF